MVSVSSENENSSSATQTSKIEKLESFLNSSEYMEIIENSNNYNKRLCIDRRMRIPWLDSQTGVAQNHSHLLMLPRQRMPPIETGQIYTYPQQRWRKKRRQYLVINSHKLARATDAALDADNEHSNSQIESALLHDTDSKDSQLIKDDTKEWYYDEADMLELEGFDEPDADSDFEYEDSYTKRRNKTKKPGSRGGRGIDSPSTPRRGGGAGGSGKSGRGRKKTVNVPVEDDKPFTCDLCNARYKTRPGLTYHYSHSHKEGISGGTHSDENSRDSPSGGFARVQTPPTTTNTLPSALQPTNGSGSGVPVLNSSQENSNNSNSLPGNARGDTSSSASTGSVYQDSYVTFLNHPGAAPIPGGGGGQQVVKRGGGNVRVMGSSATNDDDSGTSGIRKSIPPPNVCDSNSNQSVGSNSGASDRTNKTSSLDLPEKDIASNKDKAAPSPYCDFCLGDAKENKKTGTSEELVSCSDCGRSGHPTCLQFTANMIISVRKYRWQCIECKCCSICGTSDNDDQLLFCDDCDRGYHMYCLKPPLATPPEGSWSCKLCLGEFHNK